MAAIEGRPFGFHATPRHLLIALVLIGCRPAARPASSAYVASTAAASVCDSVALVWRATGRAEVRQIADTTMDVSSDSVPRRGCAVHASAALGLDTTPTTALFWNSEQPPAGWTDLTRVDADGPDGFNRTYQRPGVSCQIDFSQDGGDDSDSTYVPSPAISEATFCWSAGGG
jgi:hypothetical protein